MWLVIPFVYIGIHRHCKAQFITIRILVIYLLISILKTFLTYSTDSMWLLSSEPCSDELTLSASNSSEMQEYTILLFNCNIYINMKISMVGQEPNLDKRVDLMSLSNKK